MRYLLIGSRGRLGQAIKQTFSPDIVRCLKRQDYEHWSGLNGEKRAFEYLRRLEPVNWTVLVCSGIVDTTVDKDEICRINYLLPKNVMGAAETLGLKVITFGTVMENISSLCNPYIESKRMLGSLVQNKSSQSFPFCHLQLHTLYGKQLPSPSMFLGEVFRSLKYNQKLHMTSGTQLREYHHFDDIANVVHGICEMDITGTIDISTGRPKQLVKLAYEIFKQLGSLDNLVVGHFASKLPDNYEKIFVQKKFLKKYFFRDPVHGVCQYLETCLNEKTTKS